MARLLVTGFDAFGGSAVNPAEMIVRRLDADPPLRDFQALVLPTVYDRAAAQLLAAVDAARPDLILMFGLAGSAAALRLERFGRNRITATVGDNSGMVRAGEAVVAGGAERYETTVDLPALARRLAAAGVAAELSEDAGGFVCNHLYCSVLHALAAAGAATTALFVHVPWRHPGPIGEGAADPAAVHEAVARRLIAALLPGSGEAGG